MFYYDANCIFCRKDFRMVEGTNKYRLYKQNRLGKFSCDDCDSKIQQEAKKTFMGKLRS